jgi:hypothetical protein
MMRLLKRAQDGTITLEDFTDLEQFKSKKSAKYAILSHTWTDGQEITYQEFKSGAGRDRTGWEKIRFCVDQAAVDGIDYSWVDTCCIDKESQVELTTAINSMFRWYQNAAKCYVFLPDVEVPSDVTDPSAYPITWSQAFRSSRWFTRGWTLQELLAPPVVEFFSKERKLLGDKIKLEREIHEITQIQVDALRQSDLSKFSVEERFQWAKGRSTTKKEDKAYCLLGIFGIFLSLIYGEGEEYALSRLRDEVQRRQLGQTPSTIADVMRDNTKSKKTSHNVPFPRDPDFIERPDLTDRISSALLMPQARLALVGVGGVG